MSTPPSDQPPWTGDEGTVPSRPIKKLPLSPSEEPTPTSPPSSQDPTWRGEEHTMTGMPVKKSSVPASEEPTPISPASSQEPTWRGEERTMSGMPVKKSSVPASEEPTPTSPPSSQDPTWRGEEHTMTGMPVKKSSVPASEEPTPISPASSQDPTWRGEERTMTGMPVAGTVRATDAPAPQPNGNQTPVSGEPWRGEEHTMTGLPAAAAAPVTPKKSAPGIAPQGEGPWRGEERTMADRPVAGMTPPSADAHANTGPWRGEERTMADRPVAGMTPSSAAANANAGPWRGEERTMADRPVAGTTSLPTEGNTNAKAWRGEERTIASRPVTVGQRTVNVHEWRGDELTIPGRSVRPPAPANKNDQDATPRLAKDQEATPRTAVSTSSGIPLARPGGVLDNWHLEGKTGELTGQSFGDYEIGRILGVGGMGIIYRARQRSLNRRVAVKTLSSAYAQDPIQRARFEIEARTASLIQSPHVVAVYAAGSYNDIIYFVMEYVEGSHLGAMIAERARLGRGLDPAVALDFMLQAARGLSAAATHKVVHRDIKPSNLLITTDGTLKVADFGISKVAGESNLTRTGTAVGTPSYVSPEQARGELTDARSDLYSLGVVMYEALIGQKPFTGDNADAIIYQHNYAEPKSLRSIDLAIPESYQALVVRCLQKDPAKRYQSADELIADIERIQAGDVSVTAMLQARYGTGAEEAMRRRLGNRQRYLIPIAASLLLVAGIGGGFWYWSLQREDRELQRTTILRLRDQLRTTLDAPVRIPPSAVPDLQAMTRFVGTGDDDVARWQAKIARVDALHERLSRLDAPELPDPTLRAEANADLLTLAELVGPDNPEQVRWRARLTESTAEITRLRQVLAELDNDPDATVAQRERLAPTLALLITLTGEADPDAARWKRRLDALDIRLKELTEQLAPLQDAALVHTEQNLLRFQAALDDLRRRHGSAPAGALEVEAREAMAAQRAAIARLRDLLGRLDEVEVATASTLRRAEPDLAAYRLRVAADDAQLMRWEQKAAAAQRRITDLEERSAALDRSAELTDAELQAAGAALDALRPLLETETAQVRTRAAAQSAAQSNLESWRADLKPLESADALPLVICERARVALEGLDRRLAIGEAAKVAVSRRLLEEERRLVDLRRRCAVAEGNVPVTKTLVEDIQLFGKLVGEDSADFKRWHLRVVDYVELRRRLDGLDRPAELPKGVDADLEAFARIVGEEDRTLQGWRVKVKRVRDLQKKLAPLSTVAPLPSDAEAAIAELRTLLGEFAEAPAWSAKIARVRTLTAACTTELAPTTVLLAPGATVRLDQLRGEIGATPEVVVWSERARLLAGPGRPAWASEYTVDSRGPRAIWRLPTADGGDVHLAFRHVPAGFGEIGSPEEEPGHEIDESRFRVHLTRGRWMAESETTQALWAVITNAWPASDRDPLRPVEHVSWNDVQVFLAQIRAKFPGLPVRLPTEAEWEYACRAGGADSAYAAGDPSALDRQSWYRNSSGDRSQPVARRAANTLGLHDMLGNVWEWCEDRYGSYPTGEATDPLGTERETRVARGGSWGDPARLVRAANRVALDPTVRSASLGFRLVIDVAASDQP